MPDDLTPDQLAARRVVCAAIRKGGYVIIGARHFDSMMHRQIAGQVSVCLLEQDREDGLREWAQAEQGFIDQFGNFLTRQEAFVIADHAGQILRMVGSQRDFYAFPSIGEYHQQDLYSENIY
jgi:hypothetical protein